MVTEQFSIHADGVGVDLESTIVTVRGFDLGELLAEFPVEEILQTIEFDELHDYVVNQLKEIKEDE